MKLVTVYNNFARAKVDHDMMGRFDLPIYTSGADVVQNFFTNFKGNAIFRTGTEEMIGEAFQDCVFQEYKFRDDQNYLFVFFENTIRFLSYDSNGDFGWVLDGSSNILEITTSYTLDDCRELQFAQNADVTVITHKDFPTMDLKRTASNAFTFTEHQFTDDLGSPFDEHSATITGATQANPVVIASASHGFRSGDLVEIDSVVGMTELNGNTYTIYEVEEDQYSLKGIDGTSFSEYSSGGTAQE